MLVALTIQNLAVIESLTIDFKPGFQVLTGETGAGKSILVEALSLVLGQRAQKTWIRDGSDQMVVEALFRIKEDSALFQKLADLSLLFEDDHCELIVRRVTPREGSGQVYLNNHRVSIRLLQEVTAELVDFTGQHDALSLLNSKNDRQLLDQFLEDSLVLEQYQELYAQAKSQHQALCDLREQLKKRDDRLEWLRFQSKDFANLQLESSEQESEWRQQRQALKSYDKIESMVRQINGALTEGAQACVPEIRGLLDQIERDEALDHFFEPLKDELADASHRLEQTAFDATKLLRTAAGHAGDVDLEEIESQLSLVEKLKRKFGETLDEVLEQKKILDQETQSLKNLDEVLETQEAEFQKILTQLQARAQALTKARQKAKTVVEKRTAEQLKSLLMPKVKFFASVKTHDGQSFDAFSSDGLDQVEFLLSTNPGLDPKPLSQIASGGETSRIFLALKHALAKTRPPQTLVFDEIDTGISGAAVEMVGHKLRELAEGHQVFCITHHAQIAGLADQHYFVEKQSTPKKTITRVRQLQDEQRVDELARLLGGVKITEANLKFARELLKR